MLGWVAMELGVLAGCPVRYSGNRGWTPSWGPGSVESPSLRVNCGGRAESVPPSPLPVMWWELRDWNLKGCDMKEVRAIVRRGL